MIKNLLFAATAFVALSLGANAQTISFETSEGYSLGDINGQNGWTVTGISEGVYSTTQVVSNEQSSEGTSSFKIAAIPEAGGQGSHVVGGFYSFEPMAFNSISYDIYINDVGGSDYSFRTADIVAGSFTSIVYFSYDGAIGVLDETGALVLVDATWTPNTWYSVKVEVNDAGEIVYSIDDSIIYQAPAADSQLGNIDHIRFVHDNYSDEFETGGVAYVDNIKINDTDGSTENFAKLGLNVFPNPVSDIINITSPEANIEAVTITDLNGRTVKSINFNNVAETTVDASDLASGIYLMNITANGTVATQKIVKK